MISWQNLAATGNAESRVIPGTWSRDKYPDMPELDAGASITMLNAVGPGVITNIHVSDYYIKNRSGRENGGSAIMLRVWYDHESRPAIEMPLMDFLGDIEASCDYYDTIYFSRVKQSHNFRLPMPFRKHIKIELVNTSEFDLFGYFDLQWEKVKSIPENTGHLYADYRKGGLKIPQEKLELCDIKGPGSIVAHWFQIQADIPECRRGSLLCEANDEFYLNGEPKPSVEYLGTEDFYCYSWGFQEKQSDNFGAIIRLDELPSGGSRVAMIRCRDADKISFSDGCVGILDYTQEYFSSVSKNMNVKNDKKINIEAEYLSCYYYYNARKTPEE